MFHSCIDIDQVTLDASLVIAKQSIGVASSAQGVNKADGILGLVKGPKFVNSADILVEYLALVLSTSLKEQYPELPSSRQFSTI
jgi:hypothetical protein